MATRLATTNGSSTHSTNKKTTSASPSSNGAGTSFQLTISFQ